MGRFTTILSVSGDGDPGLPSILGASGDLTGAGEPAAGAVASLVPGSSRSQDERCEGRTRFLLLAASDLFSWAVWLIVAGCRRLGFVAGLLGFVAGLE